MRTLSVAGFAFVAVVLLPQAARAQALASLHSTTQMQATAELLQAAPPVSSLLQVPAAVPVEAAVSARSGRRAPGVVMMIVGGAGIVTGLLVSESIVTVAGAAVGGYGLYLYLNSGGGV